IRDFHVTGVQTCALPISSGAEHQFSHLWDMQSHKHNGKSPSHGFKVGIGTLSSAALYEFLYTQPLENLDVDAAVSAWPAWDSIRSEERRVGKESRSWCSR